MSKAALEVRISDAHYAQSSEFERSSKVFTRRLVPDHPSLRILDLGCGTGLNASHLAAKGHTVVGIDVSPVAVEQFRKKGFEGFVCDIETEPVPVPDGAFDLVYASEVIEHLADTGRFLGEISRLLRPDGTLVLSTPNSAFWAYRILGLLGQTASDYQHPGHVRFFSKRGLGAALEAAGFEITAFSGRHMYLVVGSAVGDALAPLMRLLGFQIEPRFATGGHFWQCSRFVSRASSFWADTFILTARKPARR
jgi:2-polyprenyl-3-methyl-5-hydroxy-6-metoxy-1,4-benzoquinol methylase